jgi:uncharacterized protein YdeI (BOF family)
MKTRFGTLSAVILSTLLLAGCGDDSGPTSSTPATGSGAMFGSMGLSTGDFASTTTVGEILSDPGGFMGQEVQLQGSTVQQLNEVEFLFTDGTGQLPADFTAVASLPTLNEPILLVGRVTQGDERFAAEIAVSSWGPPSNFSCDELSDVRARFTDPGFSFGNVVGLFLAYRGMPPGEKVLELTWDLHNANGVVEEISLGQGNPGGDGTFELEGVVAHEYAGQSRTETKQVRANLKIVGREGACSRVRDVTVTMGEGPGYAGGGTISVTVDQEKITSGMEFSVRAKVENKATSAADVAILFETPEMTKLLTRTGDRCERLSKELVQCEILGLEPGEKQTRVVEYQAPTVSRPTEIFGSVALVSGNFSPIATYRFTVDPHR